MPCPILNIFTILIIKLSKIMAAAAMTNIVTSETENSYSSKLKFIHIGVHVANQFQVYDLCN